MNEQRARAIAPPEQIETGESSRSENFAPFGVRVIGVIHDIANGVIRWQRIRYKRGVPTRGEYERYGRIEDGYPMETAIIEDYAVWKWGSGAVSTSTHPIMATFRGGYWIIEVPLKPDGSVLVGTILPAAGGQG